jgi:hypothetical protein
MRYWLAIKLLGHDEVEQQCALARIEGRSDGAALDTLARSLGFVRWRNPFTGRREWVREEVFLAHGGGGTGYVRGSYAKRIARSKVPPERRREIARLGALARKKERV